MSMPRSRLEYGKSESEAREEGRLYAGNEPLNSWNFLSYKLFSPRGILCSKTLNTYSEALNIYSKALNRNFS